MTASIDNVISFWNNFTATESKRIKLPFVKNDKGENI